MVAAIVGFFVSFAPHVPHTRAARAIIIITPFVLLVISQYLWATTGRGLLERVTCIFVPNGSSCRIVPVIQSTPAPQPEITPKSPPDEQQVIRPLPPQFGGVAPKPESKATTTTQPESPTTHGTTYVTLTESNAKDIWSTSVYSYAAGGGGPGGGLENDRLRIGGWGDQYVALIQFDLPDVACTSRVVLELYNTNDSHAPTPMYLNIITSPWDWQRGDRLWWKDLPSAEPWRNRVISAPGLNAWTSIDISDLFEKWCTKETPNYGLMLKPVENNNNYDTFYSTRYAGNDDLKPRLIISN